MPETNSPAALSFRLTDDTEDHDFIVIGSLVWARRDCGDWQGGSRASARDWWCGLVGRGFRCADGIDCEGLDSMLSRLARGLVRDFSTFDESDAVDMLTKMGIADRATNRLATPGGRTEWTLSDVGRYALAHA